MTFGADMNIENVTKYYKNNFKAVDNVNLKIEKGEFLTILGPSGSGKTTLLKLIAGFEPISKGVIRLNNEDISKKEPYLRNIGMLFQNYALFPHMTVFENVAYPLKVRRLTKDEINKKVDEILQLVQLTDFADRYPKQLSGGQQQRVALARAIVFNPPLLLLDEPLGALDKQLRQSMQIEIKRIQQAVGITTISVTHDQEEALTMSDRICVMNNGIVMQVDSPENLYRLPRNEFVASFIGEINLFDGFVTEVKEHRARVKLTDDIYSTVDVREDLERDLEGQFVKLVVRPEEIRISFKEGTFDTEFSVVIKEMIYIGEGLKVTASSPFNKDIEIKIPSFHSGKVSLNSTLRIGWDHSNATVVLDESKSNKKTNIKMKAI